MQRAPTTSSSPLAAPLITPSHSSVEQQPGLALAQSPLLSCFPAPWAGHTLCHAIASNALKEKSSRTHTPKHTQYAFVALIDTWRETRGSSRRCGGNSQMQKMQKARAYCPWKCRSHKHTHGHTHGHTRAHAATPANEIMLKLTLKSMQRFHVLAFNSRAFASLTLCPLPSPLYSLCVSASS